MRAERDRGGRARCTALITALLQRWETVERERSKQTKVRKVWKYPSTALLDYKRSEIGKQRWRWKRQKERQR